MSDISAWNDHDRLIRVETLCESLASKADLEKARREIAEEIRASSDRMIRFQWIGFGALGGILAILMTALKLFG